MEKVIKALITKRLNLESISAIYASIEKMVSLDKLVSLVLLVKDKNLYCQLLEFTNLKDFSIFQNQY